MYLYTIQRGTAAILYMTAARGGGVIDPSDKNEKGYTPPFVCAVYKCTECCVCTRILDTALETTGLFELLYFIFISRTVSWGFFHAFSVYITFITRSDPD